MTLYAILYYIGSQSTVSQSTNDEDDKIIILYKNNKLLFIMTRVLDITFSQK